MKLDKLAPPSISDTANPTSLRPLAHREALHPSANSSLGSDSAGDRPTVLLVDDERSVVEGLRDALRKIPCNILTATSGEEALGLLEQTSIDVLVSDDRMPGMTGSELLSRVRETYPETVRIMLTGYASIDSTIRAINDGEVYRFLSKPCQTVELAQTITEGVKLRRLIQSTRRLMRLTESQGRALERLEQQHPGISTLAVDDEGAILIQEGNSTLDQLKVEIKQILGEKSPR